MKTYYAGWDVGAWHCDSGTSKDAIVIKTENKPAECIFSGCIREQFEKETVIDFFNGLSKNKFDCNDNFIIAIDAVFCLPIGVQEVPTDRIPEKYAENPFLFRETEQFILGKDIKCLSMIQDRIGSQATKVMFFLKKFGFEQSELGVWQTLDKKATAIEVYPKLASGYDIIQKSDEYDAEKCCDIAEQFGKDKDSLFTPEESGKAIAAIKKEGWIWFPKPPKKP